MASKTYLSKRIEELEAELKRQKDGNFLLKRDYDKLVFRNADLMKEVKKLRKKKPWYQFWK